MPKTKIDYDEERHNFFEKHRKKYDSCEDREERLRTVELYLNGTNLFDISEGIEKMSSYHSDRIFWLEAKYNRLLENYKKRQKRLVCYYVIFFVVYLVLLTCLAKALNYEGHTLSQMATSIGSRISLSMALADIHFFITYRFFKKQWETGSLTPLWILIACIGGVAVISFVLLAIVDCIISGGVNILKLIILYIEIFFLISIIGTVGFFTHWSLYEYIFRKQIEEKAHLRDIENWIEKANAGSQETQEKLQNDITERIEKIKKELE